MKRTPLRRVSKKHAAARREYSKLSKAFLAAHPRCEWNAPPPPWIGCNRRSRDVHHIQGRGKNLNRVETWVALCREHHDFCHQYPNKARAMGLLK